MVMKVYLSALAILVLVPMPVKAAPVGGDGLFSWGHPVTVSLSGQPDFLSGEWAKDDTRRPSLASMREFDLDGKGMKMWEWPGPTEGILVWNPEADLLKQPTAADLFGFSTWGKDWSDGLGALKSLDVDGDGVLRGEELEPLWLWVDRDSNAKVGAGELKSLSDHGISSLSLEFKREAGGGMAVMEGAEAGDKSYPLVEWWSLGGMDHKAFKQYVDSVLDDKCVYQWAPEEAIDGVKGGLVRYMIAADGTLVGISMPFSQSELNEIIGLLIPYVPKGDGTFYSRADMGSTWLDNYMRVDGDILYGMTESIVKTNEPDSPQQVVPGPPQLAPNGSMTWSAKHVQGPSISLVLDAAAAKLLQD